MKRRALALLFAGLLGAGAAHAAQADHVRANHAWIRLLPGALPASGYVELANDGDQPARLTGAASTDYASTMLHRSAMHDGMSEMAMADHLDIPAHGRAALAPGGYHLMLERAARTLKPGDTVPVTLRFADGSTLAVGFQVRPANAD
ncbi:copper chaperone PCu(A)C [Fulvimonas sp. R45]|uniref:copper chaperone PCu(A)C n=1 Tax=Fulvimonas sp. R45 TaxID=3045937 RepID=UPI00265F3BBE|nr:copper chaperone PCu(A)C [Fulvimonas sp. R45]MDO1529946.1 copper chaperone PCu(A)C [Fulvimonas sp. R45]